MVAGVMVVMHVVLLLHCLGIYAGMNWHDFNASQSVKQQSFGPLCAKSTVPMCSFVVIVCQALGAAFAVQLFRSRGCG